MKFWDWEREKDVESVDQMTVANVFYMRRKKKWIFALFSEREKRIGETFLFCDWNIIFLANESLTPGYSKPVISWKKKQYCYNFAHNTQLLYITNVKRKTIIFSPLSATFIVWHLFPAVVTLYEEMSFIFWVLKKTKTKEND